MCFLCDGGTIEDLERLIAAHIIEPGWHVAGVEGAGRDASWAYTIGLLERFDHPELIVTGCCCGPCAMACVNSLAASVRDGARYAVGDWSSCLDGEVQVLFGDVHPTQWRRDWFNGWLAFYVDRPGPPVPEALQVLVQGEPLGSTRRIRLDRPVFDGGRARHRRRR